MRLGPVRRRAVAYSKIVVLAFAIIASAWVCAGDVLNDPRAKPFGSDFVTFWAASSLAFCGTPAAGLRSGAAPGRRAACSRSLGYSRLRLVLPAYFPADRHAAGSRALWLVLGDPARADRRGICGCPAPPACRARGTVQHCGVQFGCARRGGFMRGVDERSDELFSLVWLEQRIPADRTLRASEGLSTQCWSVCRALSRSSMRATAVPRSRRSGCCGHCRCKPATR